MPGLNRILTKYVLLELLGPFVLGLGIFTFLLLMDQFKII